MKAVVSVAVLFFAQMAWCQQIKVTDVSHVIEIDSSGQIVPDAPVKKDGAPVSFIIRSEVSKQSLEKDFPEYSEYDFSFESYDIEFEPLSNETDIVENDVWSDFAKDSKRHGSILVFNISKLGTYTVTLEIGSGCMVTKVFKLDENQHFLEDAKIDCSN